MIRRMADTTKPIVIVVAAACREFIKSGGTLEQWLQVYGVVASRLSDDELALIRHKSPELAVEMRRDLEQLTGLRESSKP